MSIAAAVSPPAGGLVPSYRPQVTSSTLVTVPANVMSPTYASPVVGSVGGGGYTGLPPTSVGAAYGSQPTLFMQSAPASQSSNVMAASSGTVPASGNTTTSTGAIVALALIIALACLVV